ncbi:MAG: AAA family ATPase, partial [Myxococcota bacterium]
MLDAELGPELFQALGTLQLPPDALEKLVKKHTETEEVTVAHLELFRRAVDKKMTASTLARFAASLATPGTLAGMLRTVADAGYGSSFGAAFTSAFLESNTKIEARHVLFAADHQGGLFEAERMVELALEVPSLATDWLLSPPKWLKDEQMGELASVALERVKSQNQLVSGAGLSTFLARLDSVRKKGGTFEIDPEVIRSLVSSAAGLAQNDANLGRAVQLGAALTDTDPKAFLAELLPAADQEEGLSFALEFAGWFRLLAIAEEPMVDVFKRVLKHHTTHTPVPPSLLPAIDVLARPDFDLKHIEQPLRDILRTAAPDHLGFYEFAARRLEGADPSGAKRAALDEALAQVAKEEGSAWAETRVGRRALMRSSFIDADSILTEVIASGGSESIQKLARRASAGGKHASLFVDKAFETLRAHARDTRPTLHELDTVHDIKAARPQASAKAAQHPTKVLLDEIEVPVFDGAHLVVPVPAERNLDTSLPSWRSNTIRLLESAFVPDKPTIVLGTSGTAKTSSIEWISSQINAPLLRLNGHPSATVEELFGEWELDGEGKPTFVPGLFVEMWQRGGVMLVDEFNLFPPRIQDILAEFARAYHEPFAEFSIGGQVVKLARDVNTRMVLSGNYGYAGCNAINDDLASHSNILYFDEIPA